VRVSLAALDEAFERRDLATARESCTTGVLVGRGDRWLWRVQHSSEPGRW